MRFRGFHATKLDQSCLKNAYSLVSTAARVPLYVHKCACDRPCKIRQIDNITNKFTNILPVSMDSKRSLDSHVAQGEKSTAAAATRNEEPILQVLMAHLKSCPGKQSAQGSEDGMLLEIASGTGQHAAAFSKEIKGYTWQPSEVSEAMFPSIRAWGRDAGGKVLPPVLIDCQKKFEHWNVQANSFDGILCVNMVHISPWAATSGLFAGASKALKRGGQIFLYGPYKINGKPTTESNAAFDMSLRSRNPAWGLRDVADMDAEAEKQGLRRKTEPIPMPANNFMLIYVSSSSF